MKRHILIIGLALITAGMGTARVIAAESTSQAVRDLSNANTAFALDLYARLKGQGGNLFFSPYSLSTALAMTYAGASGNTKREMAQVLHFKPGDQPHPAFAQLQASLDEIQKGGAVQLRVANSLWPERTYAFLPAFLNLAREHYGVTITPCDFIKAPEAARQQINAWVEQKTEDKIKDLIPSGALNSRTRLVLANAIYFKGNWASPFAPKLTRLAPFHVTPG